MYHENHESIARDSRHVTTANPGKFPRHKRAGPAASVREECRRAIYQDYRRGASVEWLAERHGVEPSRVRRAIARMRAERILELPLAYVPSPEFDQPDAQQQILGPMPQSDQAPRKARAPAGVPPYLASLYAIPLLTREQEVHLFRKYNYLKYLASTLRQKLRPTRPEARVMAEIERLYDQAVATKNQLIQANLRLVVSIAKRYASDADPLPDLISDGNLSLFRAVEKFDYTLGYKFSTYATWALKNNFIRGLASVHAQRERIHSTTEEVFTTQPDLRTNPLVEERLQSERESLVGRILDRLDLRERQIITSHFGLNRSAEPRSRRVVGTELGVSKERVRQLEIRAMTKLRAAVLEQQLEDIAA